MSGAFIEKGGLPSKMVRDISDWSINGRSVIGPIFYFDVKHPAIQLLIFMLRNLFYRLLS